MLREQLVAVRFEGGAQSAVARYAAAWRERHGASQAGYCLAVPFSGCKGHAMVECCIAILRIELGRLCIRADGAVNIACAHRNLGIQTEEEG